MANNITVGVNLTPEARAYFAQLQELADKKVCVGFQVGKDDYEDGTPLVEVAFCNEFGTLNEDGSVHSPSRPFMRQSVENHVDEITQACGAAAKAVGSGQMSAQQALSSIGDMLVGVTQNEIRDGEFEPNAPSTIRKKGSSKPLIDSSHMRQAVHFFIKEADE
jgi:hypothetical protein